jgi:hypothetical protein
MLRHPVWLEAATVHPPLSPPSWPPLRYARCRDTAVTIEIGLILGCYACYAPGKALGGKEQHSLSPAGIWSLKCQQTPNCSHWLILFSLRQ